MASEQARRLARGILEDRRGGNYYSDATILADYLKKFFDDEVARAAEAARIIIEDSQGANDYGDENRLADFIESQEEGAG